MALKHGLVLILLGILVAGVSSIDFNHRQCLPYHQMETTLNFNDQTPCGSGSFISVTRAVTGFIAGDPCRGGIKLPCVIDVRNALDGGQHLHQTILDSCNGKTVCSSFTVKNLQVVCVAVSGRSAFLQIEYNCVSSTGPTTSPSSGKTPTEMPTPTASSDGLTPLSQTTMTSTMAPSLSQPMNTDTGSRPSDNSDKDPENSTTQSTDMDQTMELENRGINKNGLLVIYIVVPVIGIIIIVAIVLAVVCVKRRQQKKGEKQNLGSERTIPTGVETNRTNNTETENTSAYIYDTAAEVNMNTNMYIECTELNPPKLSNMDNKPDTTQESATTNGQLKESGSKEEAVYSTPMKTRTDLKEDTVLVDNSLYMSS